jgi:hypothetical protein
VLEAAALGVPTVAFDVDGLRDAVRDGQTGWLVRDGEQIADVTERAVKELADPARRAAIAAACRQWAAQLGWERSSARMAALVGACLRNGTSRAGLPGAWIVSRGDSAGSRAGGGAVPGEVLTEGPVLAEGPVLDILLAARPDAVATRLATPLERLLGRPVSDAGDPAAGGAGWPA